MYKVYTTRCKWTAAPLRLSVKCSYPVPDRPYNPASREVNCT
jgi:hypothetical protein